jgi:hypothetical protein
VDGCASARDCPVVVEPVQVESELVVGGELHLLDLRWGKAEDGRHSRDVFGREGDAEAALPSAAGVSEAQMAAHPGQGRAVLCGAPGQV